MARRTRTDSCRTSAASRFNLFKQRLGAARKTALRELDNVPFADLVRALNAELEPVHQFSDDETRRALKMLHDEDDPILMFDANVVVSLMLLPCLDSRLLFGGGSGDADADSTCLLATVVPVSGSDRNEGGDGALRCECRIGVD